MAFNVSRAVFMQAVERLGARGIPNTGVRDRMIFDAIYFEDPLGLLIELSCWKFDAPEGFTRSDVLFAAHNLRVARGDRAIMEVHIADAIEKPRQVVDQEPVGRPIAQGPLPAQPRARTQPNQIGGSPMSAIKLHVIKPSVNNMTARVFVRAAKLDFTEDDVYGKTRTPEYSAKNPSHLTPMMEAPGLPKGVMWESCAIMQYLCNKHHLDKFYPTEPEKRAMVDSAMFYIVGTLYPYIVRSTYGALNFPQYPGEVGASDATPAEKDKAQKAAAGAVGETLDRVPQVLSRRQDLRRRRPRLDRRHPPRLQPRIPQGHRLPSSRMGEDLHGRSRQGAGRRLCRAGEGRRGLHRLCEGAEEVGGAGAWTQHWAEALRASSAARSYSRLSTDVASRASPFRYTQPYGP